MAKDIAIIHEPLAYSRNDYAALKSYFLGIDISKIESIYYSGNEPQLSKGLGAFLISMRDDLIERAIVSNPALAENLKKARLGGKLTDKASEVLYAAANAKVKAPQPEDLITVWFKPRAAKSLVGQKIATLGDLIALINNRGFSWWRPIPRFGKFSANATLRWLEKHPQLWAKILPAALKEPEANTSAIVVLDPLLPNKLAPLELMVLPQTLNGSAGINRATQFSFIKANDDLAAIHAYLARYPIASSTHLKYKKELERYLLWCALIAKKALSSQLVEDCQQYMAFLQAPHPSFVAHKKQIRFSPFWRPFTQKSLSPQSQKAAIQTIIALFDWLVKVRYLGGNPWAAVRLPSTQTPINPIQIETALPSPLLEKLIEFAQSISALSPALRLDQEIEPIDDTEESLLDWRKLKKMHQESSQARLTMAAILLMADSGIRRNELTTAMRAKLYPSPSNLDIWELVVVGKRNKLRAVPVSPRTIEALKLHWLDRKRIFMQEIEETPLLSPITFLETKASLHKHKPGPDKPFDSTSFYRLIKALAKKAILSGTFTFEEVHKLKQIKPHAFRHTFGTLAVASGMPIDVTQKILGHVSSNTTSIYVQAEKKRSMNEAAKYYQKIKPAK